MEIKEIEASQTWELRRQVMWPDKDIQFVKLNNDDNGIHYGLFECDELLSVISLFISGETAQFRKFATRTDRQRKGYGTKLLGHLIREAQQRKVKQLWCHARQDAVAFYQRFGFTETGSPFARDGISYICMSRELA